MNYQEQVQNDPLHYAHNKKKPETKLYISKFCMIQFETRLDITKPGPEIITVIKNVGDAPIAIEHPNLLPTLLNPDCTLTSTIKI